MRLQNTFFAALLGLTFLASGVAHAQSAAYKRKKPAPAKTATDATAPTAATPAASAAKSDSEKLDIKELEEKYWAPKDTDFTVVQNRTYTKAKRAAVSLTYGPAVNDVYSSGYVLGLFGSYYFDERYGVELTYQKGGLSDSDATNAFKKLSSGGPVAPDFNRPEVYYGVGFNWVPFYAKMSVLGTKIIYFDMQITPHIGMSSYDQQDDTGRSNTKSAFSYGVDITQYFFVHKNFAIRATLHSRWYNEDIVAYQGGAPLRSDSGVVQDFFMGVTYFF